jgi:hypothetical protein
MVGATGRFGMVRLGLGRRAEGAVFVAASSELGRRWAVQLGQRGESAGAPSGLGQRRLAPEEGPCWRGSLHHLALVFGRRLSTWRAVGTMESPQGGMRERGGGHVD